MTTRDAILLEVATTEDCAVVLLDEIAKDIESLSIRASLIMTKHRMDEMRHSRDLDARLNDLGIHVERGPNFRAGLLALYADMAPQTTAERYQVLQVFEESALANYGAIAARLRGEDPISAALFDAMAHDESAHIRYCQAAVRELGGRSRLAEFRDVHGHQIEVYEHTRHFEEISSWGERLDPDALGSGLVIPGRAAGFVGVVSGTRTGYFYGLRANPAAPLLTRGRAILRISRRILADSRSAGITRGVTETSNPVVARFWERNGWNKTGEATLAGRL